MQGPASAALARWGLVPYWAKDIKVGFANINAKAQGIENRPAFREAFQRRRCLVPADNFPDIPQMYRVIERHNQCGHFHRY